VFGAGFEALLFNGILALLGILLIIPLFVPSRWARRRGYEDSDSTLLSDFSETQIM
jgi:hypothetical protein